MAVANPEAGEAAIPALPGDDNAGELLRLEDNALAPIDESENVIVRRFRLLSRARQIQLLITTAAAFALVVVIFLWSSEPNYKLLYGKLSEEAAGEIVQVLKQEGIKYVLDENTGELKVPQADLHATRIALAAQGLPKSNGAGFELLEQQQGFGTSQFIEKARYNRALEGELARSISGLDAVEQARVHLAIPKQSVFIRDKQEPTASVLVKLLAGRRLDENQISAIVHMVAASIPNLRPEKVTVVDHTGKLLSKRELNGDMALSSAQFDYKRKLEEYYIERIERILIPIIGFEGVRAQVDADIDFTVSESTQESYNPDLPALRSEHTMSEESKGGETGGVPGALTNQPPGAATAPETLAQAQGAASSTGPSRSTRQETFNYELDKTISHTKQAPGKLRRMSVAVVVDDKAHWDDEENLIRTSYSPEEIDRISSLIRDAVGFNAARGDSLNVINASFKISQPIPEKKPEPFWERAQFVDIAKQAVGLILIILLLFVALRPVIKELTFKEAVEEEIVLGEEEEEKEPEKIEEKGGLTQMQWEELGISYDEYEEMLKTLRELAADDPRIVAQVIKTWLALDEV